NLHHVTEDQISEKRLRVQCEEVGAEVIVGMEPAHPMVGAGLWYELRTSTAFITRLLQGSPAERIGIAKGDEIVEINGRKVEAMSADAIRSILNATPLDGIKLKLKHVAGETVSVVLKEGPIYPVYDEFGRVD